MLQTVPVGSFQIVIAIADVHCSSTGVCETPKETVQNRNSNMWLKVLNHKNCVFERPKEMIQG